MNKYYVNTNEDEQGDHEVHKSGCRRMPAEQNRIYLGTFDNCHQAVQAAKKHYSKVNGCFHCSRECHTS